jgi:UDP-galactopyranose mutase
MTRYDVLVVGAGFAGCVLAERLATRLGKRVLIVEKRPHIAGNACDTHDPHGVLVHRYGPHYFRTNSDRVRDYLSQFTGWHPVAYRIRSFAEGRFWSFPVNLITFEQMMGRPSSTEEMEAWLAGQRIRIDAPKNSEEVLLSQVGHELYERFFKGYTLKQWKRHPRDLDPSVCGRIPLRTTRDDRYLSERFQALPDGGFTRLFERMLASGGDRIDLRLSTDYREILPHVGFSHLIYTGPIDDYFDRCFGALPYRSLRFEPESFEPGELAAREPISGKKGFWQPVMQVNYPGAEPFTRIVEIKHATGQRCANTTIVREYPEDYGPDKEPYYPIPAPDASALYRKYRERALATSGVSFVGRLATYRYYNMDQVVGMALAEFDRLRDGGVRPPDL